MPRIWKRRTAPRKSQEDQRKEKTEQIAYQVFQNRQLLGRSGDQQSDWQIAEKIVRSPIRRTLFARHCQFIKFDKSVLEPLLTWVNHLALFGLIGVIGNIGIIVGVVGYIGSEKQRRDAEVLNAWQTITSAHGQSGSGGRIEALEFLNASPGANWRRKFPWLCSASHPLCTWPQESLVGINLGVEPDGNDSLTNRNSSKDKPSDDSKLGTYLNWIQLPKADLKAANLTRAVLWEANLEGADLQEANLERTSLLGAHLKGANLRLADLEEAHLQGADLTRADLEKANLKGANLEGANLAGVSFHSQMGLQSFDIARREANLEGANLRQAHLEGADLREVNLGRAVLQGAFYSNEQTSQQECENFSVPYPCPTRFPEGFDPKAAGMKLVK